MIMIMINRLLLPAHINQMSQSYTNRQFFTLNLTGITTIINIFTPISGTWIVLLKHNLTYGNKLSASA